jgi:opacity protein-like surface antigen
MSAAAAMAVGLGFTASAQAESPFYVSGGIGGYFRQSDDVDVKVFHENTPTLTSPGSNKRDFSPGILVNGAMGYRLNSHIRFEGEFGYADYTGSNIHPFTSAAGFPELNGQGFSHTSGDTFSRYSATANVFYDFSPIATRFTPYVGAGVGAAWDHNSAGLFTNASGLTYRNPSASSTEGLAMAEGGINIAVAPHLSLVPAYRFVDYFAKGQDAAHMVKVGLRYNF